MKKQCDPIGTDIRTAIENRKAFHATRKGQTAEESIAFLESDSQNFIKDDGKYILEGTQTSLKTTVTTELGKNDIQTGIGKPAAKVGVFVHENLEKFGKEILSQLEGVSTKTAISRLKIMMPDQFVADTTSGKKFDDKSKNNLFDLARQQILFAYEEQNIINNRSNQNAVPVIKFSQILIDPIKSMGGTVDFLAVLSDNTFILRGYTTKMTTDKSYGTDLNLKDTITLIHTKDRDKYKLKVAEQARILRESYGFAGTHSNRIIPIRVYAQYNKTSGEYANLVSRVAGPNQDAQIEDIVPFTEKTGFESLDKFLSSIDEKIAGLESKKGKDVKYKQAIQERINRLNNVKKEVLIKRSINNTLDHVRYLAGQLQNMDALSMEDLLEIRSEFRMLQSLGETTSDFKRYLKSEGKDTLEIDQKISETLSMIQEHIDDLSFEIENKRVVDLVHTEIGQKITNIAGDFLPFAPEGAYAKWFYQLSRFDNPYFKTLRSLLDKANYDARQAVDKITEEVISKENAVINKLKAEGKTWKDFIKLMINPKTDNFYSKSSGEYIKMVKGLIDGNLIAKYYEALDWYNWSEASDKHQATLDQNDPVKLLEDMAVWDKYNNLSLDSAGNPRYPFAWQNAKNNGKLKLKESMIQESKEYNAIKAVPEYLAYYQMFEKYNDEFRSMLGVDYNKLPNNFLPNIRKQASERIEEWGLIKGTQSGIQDFISDFSVREDDKDDTNNYLKRDSIPRFFLNPFKDKDNNLLPGEKSYQFGRSLLIFAKMAHNYDQMSKIESNVLALRETLLERGGELIKKDGGIATNFLGNNKILAGLETGMTDFFDKFVKMYLYGISIEPILGDKSGKSEKMLVEMKNYFTLKTLGLNFISAAGGFVSAKIQANLVGKTGIFYTQEDYNKSVVAAGKDRKNFLALSGYFDPMNHRYGNIRLEEKSLGEFQIGDTSQRGWINQYVSTRTLMQPYALGDQFIDETILHALAQNYYVDEQGNLKKMKFPEDKEFYKDRTILALFSYDGKDAKLNLPPEQVKNIYIAFRRAVQVVQGKIKGTIPAEDMAAWQSNIVGQMLFSFKSWLPNVLTERVGKVGFDSRVDTLYMGRYTALLQYIGSAKNNNTGEVLALGAFLKKIVLPKVLGLSLRVLSFHTIGGYFKGYKMKDDSTRRMLFDKWLNENPQYQGNVTFEEFLTVQEAQAKTAIVELRLLLSLSMLLVLAMKIEGDDDELLYKHNIVTRKLASILLKTNQELAFFWSPLEFANLLKNPIPMVSLVSDAYKTITNTLDELFDITIGEERLLGGQTTDKKNIGAYGIPWIPGAGGMTKLVELFDENIQYSNNNK